MEYIMAKKKITVNIEEKVWNAFKQMAWKSQLGAGQNLSVSQYLENMLAVKLTLPVSNVILEGNPEKTATEVEHRMEAEKTIREKKIEKVKDLSPKISKSEQEMLKKAQELIASKKPESLTGWTGGFSKEQQTGKGAK